MANVTNIIVSLSNIDSERSIYKWFENRGRDFPINITTEFGGDKAAECLLLAGAYGNFAWEDLLEFVRAQEWEMPEAVQVFIKDEEDEVWTIHTIA